MERGWVVLFWGSPRKRTLDQGGKEKEPMEIELRKSLDRRGMGGNPSSLRLGL